MGKLEIVRSSSDGKNQNRAGLCAFNARTIVRFLLCALIIAESASALDTLITPSWVPIGPRGATVISTARNPANLAHLYVGTWSSGVYESFDGGLSWSHINSPFSNRYILSVLVDPLTPTTLYVGSFETGLYKSVDAGATWTTINNGLTNLTIQSLAVIPSSGTVLAATDTGVFYSTDGGANWTLGVSGHAQLFCKELFVDPFDNQTSYVITTGLGIYRSTDDGQNWTRLNNGLTSADANHIGLDGLSGDQIIIATNSSIFRIPHSDFAADTGSWENIGYNIDESQVFYWISIPGIGLLACSDSKIFVFDEIDTWNVWAPIPSRLLFSTPNGELIHVAGVLDVMKVTGDQGSTFHPADEGIQNRFVGTLQTVNVFGWTLIYAGDDKGVEFTSEFFLTDGKMPWILSREFDGAVFWIATHPVDPGTLYVGTERSSVWKATDFGNQWESASEGMVPRRINDIGQSRTDDETLFVGTSAGLFFSKDRGLSWNNEGNIITPRDVTAVAVHTETDQIAFYATRAGQVFRTFNGGDAFLPGWGGIGVPIRDIEIAPYFDIYIVTDTGFLFSSTDDGINFFPLTGLLGEHVMAVIVDPVRPWVIYAATKTGGVFKSETRGLEWSSSSSGITNPVILSIANSYTDDQLLYAGSSGLIFKSTDAGATWASASNGLPVGKITRLHIAPSNDSVVFATIDEEFVYRTVDGGQNWTLFHHEPGNAQSLPIISDVSVPDTLYAGSFTTGFLKSSDDGASWASNSDGMGLFIRSLATTPNEPETVYAGSLSNGLFKSTDGAATWAPMGLGDRTIFSIVIDPNDSNTLYAGSSIGVTRSSNGGVDWQDLGQLSDFYTDLVVDPVDPQIIYGVGLVGQVVKTTDAGISWNRVNNGIPKAHIWTIAYDSTTETLYVAPESEGIWRSSDHGETWELTDGALIGARVTRIETAPNGDVYIGTQTQGAFKSTNQGENWTPLNPGLDSPFVTDILISPIDSNLLYIATRSGQPGDIPVFRSDDAGVSWAPVALGLSSESVTDLSFVGVDTILLAATPTQLFQTLDGGVNWTYVSDFQSIEEVSRLLVDPIDPSIVYAAAGVDGVLKSVNGGTNWTALPPTVGYRISDLEFGAAGVILAGTLGDGLIVSDDGGASWSMGADSGLLYTLVLGVAIHPTDSNIIYAATGGSGMHKTLDGGVTWFTINSGLDHLVLLTLIIDNEEPDTLYAGSTQGGVFRTTDGGNTWQALNDGLSNKTVTSLALDANDHTILYAGTEGGGIFKIDL